MAVHQRQQQNLLVSRTEGPKYNANQAPPFRRFHSFDRIRAWRFLRRELYFGTASALAKIVVDEIASCSLDESRFAQPVRGKVGCLWKTPPCASSVIPQAKTGDTVRMVAAADVRVDRLVVFAKGAPAQATVTKVWHPFMALTGLALRLDWVEDVTLKHVPLTIEKGGKPKPFTVQVLSTTGGMIALRETLHRDLAGRDAVDASLIWRKKTWIPTGTRILSFVYGSATRNLAQVKEAQALLPISSDVATLTIYRTKGHDDSHPRVSCDGKEITQIGAQQFTIVELAPGKHGCQAEHQATLELTANAGEDYFVRLLSPAITGAWELKLMDAGEGEDTIATLELAGKP